jgi:glycosyltransferase involved in cell wall biosynthesis
MKLLVDARCLQDNNFVRRGIGRNAEGILRHARRFLPGPLEVVALLDPLMADLPNDLRALFDTMEHTVAVPSLSDGPAIFFNPSPMTHSPARILPYLGRDHILTCAFSHDLIPLEDPEYYLSSSAVRQAYFAALAALKQYRLHTPNSRHTASAIAAKLGLSADAVAVTGAVLLRSFVDFDLAKAIEHPRICRFRPGEYFLIVGGGDPRKNAHTVMAATARLARQGLRVPLVVVGNYSRELIEHLLEKQQGQGGHRGDVQFLQGINDGVLTALYKHARACICPSKSEGFSMPVIEAMACGAPVLASNCPAQVELIDQPGALFPPDDIESIAAIIERAIAHPEWLEQLRQAQAPVPRRFAEEEVAARVWMHIRRHLPHNETPCLSPRPARPRMAFLAPYPERGDTNMGYLPMVLRELAMHADLTVFTATRQPRPDSWVKRFEPLSAMAHVSGEFESVINVLGLGDNMRRHYWLAERYGGPCLLFHTQLAAFYIDVFGPQRARDVAERSLHREVMLDELTHWVDNPHDAADRFLAEIGRWSHPLVAHSRIVSRALGTSSLGSVEWLAPCLISAPGDDELSADRRAAARARLGLDPRQIHLLHLGEPQPALIPALVHAFEQLRAWKVNAHLHCVGIESRPAIGRIGELAARLAVAEHMHMVRAPLTKHARADWLAAADLGIAIQPAGAPGVPDDLYAMLAAGMPAVANSEAVQGLGLPSLALEVPDVPGPLLIAEQWLQAIEARRHGERLTDERRRFVEERQPRRYAQSLLHLLNLA